jgi:hypothetical protein
VDNKNFSERIVTTPVSALGQKTFIDSGFATSITLPSTLINDPRRQRLPENEEQPIADYHGYAFVTDLEEGLIVADVATLLDGNPANNFIRKAASFNPDGALDGARHSWMAGQWLYITTAKGLAVVDVMDPEKPIIAGGYTGSFLRDARQSTVQWHYWFVTDADGVKVFDISNPAQPRPVNGASVPLGEANGLYAARTYLYVAQGLAIIDIKNPEKPGKLSDFTAGGKINDARDVQIGSVNASMYAHIADGHNGLRIVQMISPENVPGHMGFSPKPEPKLIASYPTKAPAVTVSRGLDRDRVVDESGNQTVVFGRRGSRPFNLVEMAAFFRKSGGAYYRVSDVSHGENGSLTDARQRTLTPNEDFAVPATAKKDTLPTPSGRLKKRRAPVEFGR